MKKHFLTVVYAIDDKPETVEAILSQHPWQAAANTDAIADLEHAQANLQAATDGYDAARLEIESLQARIQELGQQARECSDRKVVQLESALARHVRSGKDWAMRVEALERTITTLRAHIASSNAQAAAAKKAMREPEAQVAAVGAGGMEPLRKTNSVEFDGIKTYHGQLLRAALQEAEAALEVALARILKRDPGHAVNVTSEAKALVIVRSALAESQTNHFRGATEMVQADAPVVLPEPVAYYDGERWYANEESAICACADMPKLQKVYTEQQVRAMLATGWHHRKPNCITCNDHGAVGNILTAEPCPDCTPPKVQADARDATWLTTEGRAHGFRVMQDIPGAVITHSTDSLSAAIAAAKGE